MVGNNITDGWATMMVLCKRSYTNYTTSPPKSSPCIWSYECVIQFNWFESDFNIVSLSVKPFSLKTHQRVAPRLCNPNAESSVEVIATVTFVRRHIQPTIIHQTLLLASHHIILCLLLLRHGLHSHLRRAILARGARGKVS